MKVTVNGKPLEIAGSASLADFIAARKLEARSPIVELNGEIVRKISGKRPCSPKGTGWSWSLSWEADDG